MRHLPLAVCTVVALALGGLALRPVVLGTEPSAQSTPPRPALPQVALQPVRSSRPIPPKQQVVQLHAMVLQVDHAKLKQSDINPLEQHQAEAKRAGHSSADHVTVVVDSSEAELLAKVLTATGAKVLAAPQMVTVVGRSASVLSGGEIPILVTNRNDAEQVEVRSFGTRVEILPQLVNGGVEPLRLKIDMEHSTLGESSSTISNSATIPSIRSRAVSATIDVEPGTNGDRTSCCSKRPDRHGSPGTRAEPRAGSRPTSPHGDPRSPGRHARQGHRRRRLPEIPRQRNLDPSPVAY